jgi:NAD(P)-dependent dehydrogenase (short-subunit alcohol dehydrogenase family)
LTKSLAAELGQHQIRVLGVAPTFVSTEGTTDIEARGIVDDMRSSLALGRFPSVDDIAGVALFCVSDMAAAMTGTTVIVDGGSLSCG